MKEKPMFTINKTEFGWDEIAAAAQVWGEWGGVVESARRGLACFKQAVATGEIADCPSSGELQTAATEFRYAHNLISGQETQTWIATWGLTVDAWMNYFRRSLLKDRWAGPLNDLIAQHPVTEEEIAGVIKCEAVCCGKFAEWTNRLAGRAALTATSDWLKPESPRSPQELIERIEAAFHQLRQQVITPKLLQAKIADHQLDWVRFECRYVWFPEERIAREALMCVTEDGLTLDEVAADARGIVQQWSFYLDEIEPAAHPQFLAARTGDWLGPVKMMEGFPIFSITTKKMPADADPQIRQRAETAIVNGLIEQKVNELVKWK